MKKFNIQAQQKWPNFTLNDIEYPLDHLNVHTITFSGEKHEFSFVVTYGLHCFAKDNEGDNTYDPELAYPDGREIRPVCFERYQMSKSLPKYIESFHMTPIKVIGGADNYRVIELIDKETGGVQEYKIGFSCFKENRLFRLHVTTAFIERREDLKVGTHKNTSIFQIGLELKKRPRNAIIPKEAKNRLKD
ncbi:MAG: hypothetical protein ACRCVV_15560 [Shewanella sp.]